MDFHKIFKFTQPETFSNKDFPNKFCELINEEFSMIIRALFVEMLLD